MNRNMLTPCEHLIIDEPVDQDTGLSKRVPRSSRSPALAAQENSASDTDDDDELSFMPALSSRSNAGMAAIPTSNENEAFSAVDEVNDDEVSNCQSTREMMKHQRRLSQQLMTKLNNY